MASFWGKSFWQYANIILQRREVPEETIESKLGEQWDALCESGRAHVEGTNGLACVQTISVSFKVKTYRSENGEMANEITPTIKGVIPVVPLPSRVVFLDKENVAHTVPQQIDMGIMGIKGSVDGGKQDAAKPAVKVG